MIILAGVLFLIVAAMVGGMLIFRNNREKADMVVDKSEKIFEVLKS